MDLRQNKVSLRNASNFLKVALIALALHLFMVIANNLILGHAPILPSKVKFAKKDTTSWTIIKFDEVSYRYNPPALSGVFWLQAHFENIEESNTPSSMKELAISLVGSYEVYVNGTHLANNGKVGSSISSEQIGQLDRNFVFPKSMMNRSINTVTLRVSNFHNKYDELDLSVALHDYEREDGEVVIKPMVLFTLAGVFLTGALYYFFLFLLNKRRLGYILFAIFCLVLFAFIIQSNSRVFLAYNYTQYYSWKTTSSALSLLAAILLPVFLIENFFIKRKPLYMSISIVVVAGIHTLFFEQDEMASLFISALIATGVNITAILNKRVGAWESLLGPLIFLVGAMTFELSLFIGFAVLAFSNLFSMAVIQRESRLEYEMSIRRSARLEAELLKKHLNPHFLLNSLTNIISLIESKPKLSIAIIEALSEEFHELNIITNKNLIPISQEIKLCKAHLKVMQIRNDIDYEFECFNEVDNLQIPPAIIHTLLENGITHNEPIEGSIRFKLTITAESNNVALEFISTGRFDTETIPVYGTGLDYVKSRLEETYSKNWHFETGAISDTQWRTLIQFGQ